MKSVQMVVCSPGDREYMERKVSSRFSCRFISYSDAFSLSGAAVIRCSLPYQMEGDILRLVVNNPSLRLLVLVYDVARNIEILGDCRQRVWAADAQMDFQAFNRMLSVFFDGGRGLESAEVVFTRRELEIYSYLFRGFTAKQISAEDGISPSTVNSHKRHIYQKLRVHSCTEMICKSGCTLYRVF